jgi:hypothetical protein
VNLNLNLKLILHLLKLLLLLLCHHHHHHHHSYVLHLVRVWSKNHMIMWVMQWCIANRSASNLQLGASSKVRLKPSIGCIIKGPPQTFNWVHDQRSASNLQLGALQWSASYLKWVHFFWFASYLGFLKECLYIISKKFLVFYVFYVLYYRLYTTCVN